MRTTWRHAKRDKKKIRKAARLGAEAFWRRYYADADFRASTDSKLSKSRSRGGTNSWWKLEADEFKRRQEAGHVFTRARLVDHLGNKLRSSWELPVANLLARFGVPYVVEPRLDASGHAFYPDFSLEGGSKLIEVVAFAGDRYWDHTTKKLKFLTDADPRLEICVVTAYKHVVCRKFRGSHDYPSLLLIKRPR